MGELKLIGERAREAKRFLAVAGSEEKNKALKAIADALEDQSMRIVSENEKDLFKGRAAGLSEAMLDRLKLHKDRILLIADSVRKLILLPDPVGRILEKIEPPNGLSIVKTAVPIGVLAVIYEARPNVTVDSAALCLKSGNAVILRGGKEAICSNRVLADCMREALESAGFPKDSIQLVQDTKRESATELMRLNAYVDALIPRGGQGLIKTVVENSTVPVIETGAGTCHTYVDQAADLDMAVNIIINAKTSRPSVCNACECMLIHKAVADALLPRLRAALFEKQVEIRGDQASLKVIPDITQAKEEDWGKEYNDFIIACKVVHNIEEALEHIYRYSTGHSECIVTEDKMAAEKFLNEVDAAAVYVNASTRFTDGGEFGMGAEIGISTQKLHARGPLGLNELTSMKYKVYGTGQIR